MSLAHLPLALFAVPMGLGGLGLMWREAARVLGAPTLIGEAVLLAMALAWGAIAAAHGLRLLRHPGAVRAELAHPVRAPFAGAISIGLMLIAAALIPHAPSLAALVWAAGVTLHLLIATVLLRRILLGRAEPAMLAPPLLIPLVGTILAPAFGAQLGQPALSWVLFGIGTLLWLLVQPLLLHRLLAGPPLPERLRPALVIFLAPPAIAALAAGALLGDPLHPLSLAAFGAAVFIATALLAIAPEIARVPFGLAHWGLSFPTAAFAVAALQKLDALPSAPGALLAALLLGGVTAVILWLCWRTLGALRAGAFLRPEH